MEFNQTISLNFSIIQDNVLQVTGISHCNTVMVVCKSLNFSIKALRIIATKI